MKRIKKIVGFFLGFGKDDDPEQEEDEHEVEEDRIRGGPDFQPTGSTRKGFGISVQVPVERSIPGPVLIPCNSGDGGVQGLQWCAKRLRIDEEGDVAHEFLDEVAHEVSSGTEEHRRQYPKFQVRQTTNTRQAKVKEQVMGFDGRIQHCVEHQGRLQWV